MSQGFPAIDWNPRKRRYDLWMAGLSGLFLLVFIGGMLLFNPNARPETVLLRSTGILALGMLHVVLAIGPMARIWPATLPLLYNRRHLGVMMAIVASVHAGFALFQFHALGDVPWLVSLFGSNTAYGSLGQFPFQVLGFLAWIQLLLMAATSHDAWLALLGPRAWKSLHLGVYVAYALLLGHVLLGVIQLEQSPWGYGGLGLGAVLLIVLHLAAAGRDHAGRETRKALKRMAHDPEPLSPAGESPRSLEAAGYARLGPAKAIAMDRARMLQVGATSIAVFKHAGGISAVRNACKHQGGPLAEGKVVDGCITCPWHGWQYKPENGCSPPPFDERLATFRVALDSQGDVWVHPKALPEGTPVTPAPLI